MFATSLTLADSASANKTFNKINNDVDQVLFMDSATSLATPRKIQIKHTLAKDGVNGVDRHLVSFSVISLDASNKPVSATVNVTIAMPRSVITRTQLDDLVAFAKNFLSTTNVTAVLNGEV